MNRFAVVVPAAALLALVGCGGEQSQFDNRLLAGVPADTPYVFASGEPVDEAVSSSYEQRFAPAKDLAFEQIESAFAGIESENPELAAMLRSLWSEFEILADAEGRESIGITREDRIVLFGRGLWPVLQVTLTDPDKFRAFLGRLTEKSGVSVKMNDESGADLWRFPLDQYVIVAGVRNGMLAVSGGPADQEAAFKAQMFGESAPAESLADSGRLDDVVARHGLAPFGAGYLDTQRLAALLVGEGDSGGLLETLGALPADLPAACRSEARQLSAKAPGLVFGYDEMTREAIGVRMILELDPAIAEQVRQWPVAVPGLGEATDARYAVGMSLDIPLAANTVKGWLRHVAENPFECPPLAEPGWNDAADTINVTPVYMVGNPRGFLVRLDELEIRDLEAHDVTVAGSAVFAFENAKQVAAMAQGFVPQLQSMQLEPGGAPVQVPAEAMQGVDQSVWVATTETLLGIAVGDSGDGRVSDAMSAPTTEHPPLLSLDFDAGWFYGMLADHMPKVADMDDDMDEEARRQFAAQMESSVEMMRLYGRVLDRLSINVLLTEQGVEIVQRVTLN